MNRLRLALLALVAFVGLGLNACGSKNTTTVNLPVQSRVACFSFRCVQILTGISFTDFKYFPVFEPQANGPEGLDGFAAELRTFDPTLLVVPNDRMKSFETYSGEKLELTRPDGFEQLLDDVSALAEKVGMGTSGDSLMSELTGLSVSANSSERFSVVWIAGAVDLGDGFFNLAVEGSEARRLLDEYFRVVDGAREEFSLDEVVTADADVLFYTDFVSEPMSPRTISSDPRWLALRAVQLERAFVIPRSDGFGYGPTDYRAILKAVNIAYRSTR